MALNINDQFVLFSKFGDPRSDGKTITLTQSDKWLKQAQILDGRAITLTDTGVLFNKFNEHLPMPLPKVSLQQQYVSFSKFGDSLSDGKSINLNQLEAWFRQANVIDEENICRSDIEDIYNKFLASKGMPKSRTINFSDFMKYIEDIAKEKNADPDELMSRLVNCGPPGTSKLTSGPVKTDTK